MTTYIGIDNSIQCPCLVIYKYKKWYIHFFSQRKREERFTYDSNNVFIGTWEYPNYKSREERFHKVTECIAATIFSSISTLANDYKIGIENYSFGSSSSSVTGLAEIGGVLRHKLYKYGLTYEEIPPKKIKKHFTGNGNSNKFHMTRQFDKENIVDLYKELKFTKKQYASVPHPIEDIVDATAIVYYLMDKPHKNINIIGDILKRFDLKCLS